MVSGVEKIIYASRDEVFKYDSTYLGSDGTDGIRKEGVKEK